MNDRTDRIAIACVVSLLILGALDLALFIIVWALAVTR